ncbi:T9SS C-terminal target domain-containing protein [Hymenobacter sediminis]|uniref:T9SS type A sorting domain-containing protein n=1 Tax=Hymenobacter sediminis TaxID=2218621 RepID=UPI000DA6A9E2|nr:T9SS type A sorting domain-containing protein [Hymenobacter sediminis]RPD44384.1 T9SS C-terminal target domain-containing protein [Hymenobacter sediminis]
MTKRLPAVLTAMGLLFTSLTQPATAQAPTKQWDKTFGGSGYDDLRFLVQTADGGYILGGESESGLGGDKSQAGQGRSDYWVVKLNANGSKQWDKTVGGSEEDYLQVVQQTRDGGYILGGWSASGVSGDRTEVSRGRSDYWLVKLDATGQKQWDKAFGGNGNDYLRSLQQTPDGGYILGGDSHSTSSGEKTQDSGGFFADFWLVKVDATGTKQWDKTYGGADTDQLTSVQLTADGGYILAGISYSDTGGDKTEARRGYSDYWLVKVDANGSKQWDKTFGGTDYDFLFAVQPTREGGYLLGGSSQSGPDGDKTQSSQGKLDQWLVKVDANGTKLWDRAFGSSDDDLLLSLQQAGDGGAILAGTSFSGQGRDKTQPSQGLDDYWLVKVDAAGTKLWDRTYGGSGSDYLFAMQQTRDEGYILGGRSDSGLGGDKSQASQGDKDFWVVKVEAASLPLSTKAVASQTGLIAYPNPASASFTLRGSAGSAYQLLNQLGQVVRSGRVSAQPLDIQTLPAGLYLLREPVSGYTTKLIKE